ncbi:MAG: zinc dependent phospholipase C family protein [Eggerthellaceae bacterium]|nr:zinc dependent phospholipase C family protein [Eggerthellaceae bacterium]
MPAVITHDLFGHDVYHEKYEFIGGSRQEADAFLLGNQGPDPLFFSVLSPHLHSARHLGGCMHKQKVNELLAAFNDSLKVLSVRERPVGRAYALGFLCHYLLDGTVHPFVYCQEYAVCDAGEPGLDRSDHSEVHAVIETEFDEIALYAKRGETVSTFNPARQTMKADRETLAVISKMYVYVALAVYGRVIPADTFAASVRNYRFVSEVLHSRSGAKRAALSRIELLARRHSFYGAMSHRPMESVESVFDNRAHEQWENPFTGEASTDGFWDRLDQAQARVDGAFSLFDAANFGVSQARAITGDLDFSGRPTNAVLVAVSDAVPRSEEAGEASRSEEADADPLPEEAGAALRSEEVGA